MNKSLSIIVPLLNEEENLDKLYHQITKNIPEDYEYEIIFIDDGSKDNSLVILQQLAEKNNRVKIISFRKNFGKSAAYIAGFQAAQGRVIITMDADLQDNPHEIPGFLDKIEEGNDMVIGWKKKRHDPLTKTIPSKIFNGVIRSTTGLKLHDIDCGFRAFTDEVSRDIKFHGNLYRFIPVFANLKGYRITEITVLHKERRFGKSKFGAKRLLGGLFDFFTVLFISKYLEKPMHFFGLFGLIMTFSGFVISAYLAFIRLFYKIPLSNRPLLLLGLILIIVGIQFFSLGLLAEFILSRQKTEPDFSIKKKINL